MKIQLRDAVKKEIKNTSENLGLFVSNIPFFSTHASDVTRSLPGKFLPGKFFFPSPEDIDEVFDTMLPLLSELYSRPERPFIP